MLYLITISDSAEQARAQAANALDELMRISLVAQSTLKFHRESGSPRIALLSEVLDSVLTMFRGRIQTTNIEVDIKAMQELPITCMLSETQQVFANLIANAIESMPSGGRLIVRIQPSRDWRNRAISGMRVTICDTGGGIDRDTQSRIFEPFFTTKTDTGTGLGLWVVAQLIERHDGAVSVWSSQRPGASGTAFSIFLPFGEELFGEGSIDRGKGVASIRPLSPPYGDLYAPAHSTSSTFSRDSRSVASRFAVMAAMVLSSREFSGLRIDSDTLAIRPMAVPHVDGVTHLLSTLKSSLR